MTFQEITELERTLEAYGYRKIYQAKAHLDDDYEWAKAFRDDDGELRYQTFFQFWNFEKYQAGAGWSVSVAILPNSLDDLGRRDLQLSTNWTTNVDKVQTVAESYYWFIKKMDVL